MKRVNLTVITILSAALFIAMLAFQPTNTEASSSSIKPSPVPTQKRRKPVASPTVVTNPKIKNPQPCSEASVGRENSIECLKTKNPRYGKGQRKP